MRRHLIFSLITGAIASAGIFWILRSSAHTPPLIMVGLLFAIVFVSRLLEAFLGVMATDRTLRTYQILRALPLGFYCVSAFLAAQPATLRYAPWVGLAGVLLHFGVSRPYIKKLRTNPGQSVSSPFQSPEAQEIFGHLTPEEHARVLDDGRQYGQQMARWFAIPLGLVVASFLWSWQVGLVLLVLFLVYLRAFALPRMGSVRRRTKELLCATEWARSRGYTPERLRLTTFSWSK